MSGRKQLFVTARLCASTCQRTRTAPREIADDRLLNAAAIVHVAAETADAVAEFCTGISRLLEPNIQTPVIGGVVRPPSYTGNAMHNFAYAHGVLEQPGSIMPNGFVVPIRKTTAWWQKDWMERHTYFLPRYDDSGRTWSVKATRWQPRPESRA
jgi:hypothetical protein